MIDFRYHVVSLISVFLALAVGIALGAGPLKESIGAQLTGQVEQLRNEKSELREQLDQERDEANLQRAFALATADDLLGDLLTDRNIALLATAGVEKQTVDGTIERIEQADGNITARFNLEESFTSTSQRAFRSSLASSLTEYLDPEPEDEAGVEEQLAMAVGQLLTARSDDDPEQLSDNSSMLQELLVSADLITPVSAQTAPADLILILTASTAETEESEEHENIEAFNDTVSELAVVLKDIAEGVVVAGSGEETEDALFAIRKDHAGVVTTVDSIDFVTGQMTAVLALADAIGDPGNAYGARANADLVAPGRTELDPPADTSLPERDPDSDPDVDSDEETDEGTEPTHNDEPANDEVGSDENAAASADIEED